MTIGCSFICVFAVLINKVSLQVTVEAVIGGSVVLPCSSTEHDLKPQELNVHWRHNGSENVYDIIKGKDSAEKQDQRYKNRTETFPDEFLRGNFSIKLINLQHSDAGKYNCLITPSSEQKNVQLIIKESTEQENQGPETSLDQRILWICVGTLLSVFIVVSIIAYFIRWRLNLPYRQQQSEI